MEKYRYKLINTGAGSHKYGSCQVCKKPANEIFHQIEEKEYSGGWTHYECFSRFGHKECLKSIRRDEK